MTKRGKETDTPTQTHRESERQRDFIINLILRMMQTCKEKESDRQISS